MTDWQTLDNRNSEITQAILQDFCQAQIARKHIFRNPTEVPQANASEVLQQAGGAPMGEQPVDSVGRFSDVFHHQDRAIQ
jgi:hypothetical protein